MHLFHAYALSSALNGREEPGKVFLEFVLAQAYPMESVPLDTWSRQAKCWTFQYKVKHNRDLPAGPPVVFL